MAGFILRALIRSLRECERSIDFLVRRPRLLRRTNRGIRRNLRRALVTLIRKARGLRRML